MNSVRAAAARPARRARPSYTSAAVKRGADDRIAAVTRSKRASPAISSGVGIRPCARAAAVSAALAGRGARPARV